MTGFRFGKSGSLEGRAKTAGRAIGKRKSYRTGCLFLPPSKPFTIPQKSLLSSKPSAPPSFPMAALSHIKKNKAVETAIFPVRPRSATTEMWEDYRIFKAAGLLQKWREKWAGYLLPVP